jgi:hypothetical protein
MGTALEEQVENEQAEHDEEVERDGDAAAGIALEPDEDGHGQQALLDRSQYEREDRALPKVDGEPTDKIAIAFSGRVLLDRTDPRDVALMRRMLLGQDVTLMVEAKCSGKGHGFTTNKEGDLDAVVLEHRAKVHTVYRPAGEDLGEEREAA